MVTSDGWGRKQVFLAAREAGNRIETLSMKISSNIDKGVRQHSSHRGERSPLLGAWVPKAKETPKTRLHLSQGLGSSVPDPFGVSLCGSANMVSHGERLWQDCVMALVTWTASPAQ